MTHGRGLVYKSVSIQLKSFLLHNIVILFSLSDSYLNFFSINVMFFKCVYVVVVIVNNFGGHRGSFWGHVRCPQLADGASLVV